MRIVQPKLTFVADDGRTFPLDMLDMSRDATPYEGSDPDDRWKHVDKQGHAHRWLTFHGDLIVTAAHIESETYFCWDDNEDETRSWWACDQCAEVLHPGYRRVTRFIRGPIEMKATLKYLSKTLEQPPLEGVVDLPGHGPFRFVRVENSFMSVSGGGGAFRAVYQGAGPVEERRAA